MDKLRHSGDLLPLQEASVSMTTPIPARKDHAGPGGATVREDIDRAHTMAHLRKAEGDIAWLRWIGMALWAVVLYRQGIPAGWHPAWVVFAMGVAYSAHMQWRLRDPGAIRTSAWLATIGDPLLAASMCQVTGGIDSVFFPFLFFTLLAAAFRFGARETVGVFALNTSLAVLLYNTAPNPNVDIDALMIAIFYLGFSAALGAMLAAWARENINLAMTRTEALRDAHARSRSLLHRLIDVQEDERKRIAGDLHDGMGGHLFTLQQGLDECARRCGDDTELKERLTALAVGSRACTTEVRNLMNELRPTVLDDLGFHAALGDYVSDLADAETFSITVNFDPTLEGWRSVSDAMLFRIVQEALLNVRKHAQANKVEIELVHEDGAAVLRIEDDGCGFVPRLAEHGHYGLLTMRERAEALGGELDIDSEPSRGTRITLRLPFDGPL
tara:strand:- start:2024 stop:3349 length:1326 start_codon:yes stop_codon:yes gene_type:complete